MPRGRRYIVAGRTYHLTRRCHNRKFLFRFAKDRDAYRMLLRDRSVRYGISVLTYCITSNHTSSAESLAVGSEAFAREVGPRIRNRMAVEVTEEAAEPGSWVVRGSGGAKTVQNRRFETAV